ncbi:expressed unknown protein [Ectocarpus siliculosus]|uniref:Uncharacterized protein n=1 Tax=Ectocarpus siliculosus TaxID=2880 RepID=D7FTC1_ECTSI|nr:expressed unknown protein [Ectocarpus siliculosus]|eukprot:CBJ31387.1 expressed unknown protein [Ectocarpus siliculosus]
MVLTGKRAVHGKEAPGGGPGLCFACGRPGSRDGCSSRWKHVGQGTYWAELGEWSAIVGEEWPHERDTCRPSQSGRVHLYTARLRWRDVQKVQEAPREGGKRV